ncbi:VOC family protein [Streptomyces sp. NBC_01750]|uniref:VOC family protein n=1 Tax=Streptomyces sp. NBC_01750 TaxID=2975928 RepID=UPI002DD897BE|nr:VOC family protein [Streptomyces sp. NBC_01750]WSD32764.1 VOC family protein [Streptomyces sp. NBC_01750]
MAALPEGTPCWADAMFPDVEAAKGFYGELMGWTYDEGSEEFVNYTQARSDGKRVAAVVPQMPGMDSPAAWNLYFATTDAAATAAKIRENDGTLMMEPTQVGDFGTMVTAQDPSGVVFSVWQPLSHKGFEKTGEPGSFAWAEVTTRDAAKADAFFTTVFPFEVQKMKHETVDFHVWNIDGRPVAGRMRMTDDFLPDFPPYVNVYFAVADCDAAIATVDKLGGRVHFGPTDSPFGRMATVADQQGAVFSVIDLQTTKGEMPEVS